MDRANSRGAKSKVGRLVPAALSLVSALAAIPARAVDPSNVTDKVDLVRVLGVRSESKPLTAPEIDAELVFVLRGLDESNIRGVRRDQTRRAIERARGDLAALIRSERTDSADVKARARWQALNEQLKMLLDTEQMEELNRRTRIIVAQETMLAAGPQAFLDETVEAMHFYLSDPQRGEIRKLLDDAADGLRKSNVQSETAILKQTREDLRALLTPQQRAAWDDWCVPKALHRPATSPASRPAQPR